MEDDLLIFADENPSEENLESDTWKVLVADDEKAVHLVTKLALGDFSYDGKPLELLSAYNEEDVKAIMSEEEDIALVLLDVVMDTVDSGFNLIRFIRHELGNKDVRIILRTGQSGTAPEDEVIINYDINDFKDKTELTVSKLRTTIISALKAYSHLKIIAQEQTKLLESRLYLDQIIEGLYTAVITVDADLKIIHWNTKACKLLAMDPAQLEGMPLNKATSRLDPFLTMIKECLEEGAAITRERIPFPDDQVVNLSVKTLDLGKKTHLVIRLEDVTLQRRRDSIIQRNQQVQTLSTLMRGFKKELESLMGQFGHALSDDAELKDRFDQHFAPLLGQSIERFNLFQRLTEKEAGDWQPLNLGELLKKTPGIPETNLYLGVDPAPVYGNRESLEKMLELLVGSALGSKELSFHLLPLGEASMEILPIQNQGQNYVLLEVQDTTQGLAAEWANQLIDPFQGGGEKQGLSLVAAILEAHHGFLDLETYTEKGSCLRLFFPVEGRMVSRPQESSTDEVHGKILVCDDETLMKQVTTSILSRLGYEVIFTSDGYAAIEEYKERMEEIDLVLLDMLMPGIDGVDLFRKLKEINPEVKVILSSGFGRFGKIEEALEQGIAGYLQKPFGLESLSKALKDALSS
jgi:PAS domain S-box-containing protein